MGSVISICKRILFTHCQLDNLSKIYEGWIINCFPFIGKFSYSPFKHLCFIHHARTHTPQPLFQGEKVKLPLLSISFFINPNDLSFCQHCVFHGTLAPVVCQQGLVDPQTSRLTCNETLLCVLGRDVHPRTWTWLSPLIWCILLKGTGSLSQTYFLLQAPHHSWIRMKWRSVTFHDFFRVLLCAPLSRWRRTCASRSSRRRRWSRRPSGSGSSTPGTGRTTSNPWCTGPSWSSSGSEQAGPSPRAPARDLKREEG